MKKFNIILALIAIVCFISCGHNANYKSSAEKNDTTKSSVPKVYCEELVRLAENGNAEAQCMLGAFYWAGEDIEKDDREGFKWFLKAAEQGHPKAQYAVALSYHNGIVSEKMRDFRNDTVVHQNDTEAFKWFLKAAEQGYPEAQTMLVHCYKEGTGTAVDYKKAAKWARRCAETGHPEGQYAMGCCYAEGIGVQQNVNEALKWLAKAAEQGHQNAAFDMAVIYYYAGSGEYRDEAVRILRQLHNDGYMKASEFLLQKRGAY